MLDHSVASMKEVYNTLSELELHNIVNSTCDTFFTESDDFASMSADDVIVVHIVLLLRERNILVDHACNLEVARSYDVELVNAYNDVRVGLRIVAANRPD